MYFYIWMLLVLNRVTWSWFGFEFIPWVFSIVWSRNFGLLSGSGFGFIALFLGLYAIVRVLLRVVFRKLMAKSRSRVGRVRLFISVVLWILIAQIGGRAMSREPWHIPGKGRREVWDFPWCTIWTRTLAWVRKRKDDVMHYSRYVYQFGHFVIDMYRYFNVVEYIWLLIMFPCCIDHHWYGML